MIIKCENCEYYHEGSDGEYGGGSHYVECGNAVIDTGKRAYLGDLLYFPYNPSPACFVPNIHLLPDHFFEKSVTEAFKDGVNYYEWLCSAKEWDGDHISLIEANQSINQTGA